MAKKQLKAKMNKKTYEMRAQILKALANPRNQPLITQAPAGVGSSSTAARVQIGVQGATIRNKPNTEKA